MLAQRVHFVELRDRKGAPLGHGQGGVARLLFTASTVPVELALLSSIVAFPYPFELEAGPTSGDRADGAFIAGCLGLLARGLIEIALEDDGPDDGINSLWLKRGVRNELPQPKLEAALLEGLAGFQHHAGYRVGRTEWVSLGLLLAAGGDGWPMRRELAGASLAPYHLVDAVEHVSLGMPELFTALASAAKRLPP